MLDFKDDINIKTIVDILKKNDIKLCYLFGSYGTEDYKVGESDIDIAIVTDKDYLTISGIADELETITRLKIDLVRLDKIHLIIQLIIANEGIILIDTCKEYKEEFLERVGNWYKTGYSFWCKINKTEEYPWYR
ncbi:MAG: nucleotidyltransferase family protein [Anaeroplasmataceae bacterium]